MLTMEEARHIAGRCWTEDTTSDKEMDCDLAEIFARRLVAVSRMAYDRGFEHGGGAPIPNMSGPTRVSGVTRVPDMSADEIAERAAGSMSGGHQDGKIPKERLG